MVRSEHTYRPDVDGLRALAVIPVVLFHADMPLFSGGFVGVDVFFVISGFLITSLILKEHESNTFILLNFWERRVRRIAPALAVVVCFVAVVGWFLFLPNDFTDLAQSILAQGVFSSNVLFWAESGYFDGPSELKPLLHTWSLSVEEQFYIVFPLLLALLTAAMLRFRSVVVVALALGSLALSMWAVSTKPTAAFYLLPFRAWELLLGAVLPICRVRAPDSPRVRELLGVAGLALIAVPVVSYDATTRFPGLAALAPCVGAASIIWVNSKGQTAVGRFLSMRPLVAIGLISYSLYLWHWPLLVFARYASPLAPLTSFESVGLVTLAVVLSWLSWKYVETPVRRRRVLPKRTGLFATAGGVWLVVAAFGIGGYVTGGFPSRVPPEILAYNEGLRDTGHEHCLLDEAADLASAQPCIAGRSRPQSGGPRVLFFGDSHLDALMPVIEELAMRTGQHVLHLSYTGCPPLFGVSRIDQPADHQCKEFNEKMLATIRENKIDHVVLVSYWSSYALGREHDLFAREGEPYLADEIVHPENSDEAKDVFRRALIRTVETLNDVGADVWIFEEVPSHTFSVADSLAKLRLRGDDQEIVRPLEDYTRRTAYVAKVFSELESPTVHILDPMKYLCSKRGCLTELSHKPLYSDNNHLTPFGSKQLRPLFEPLFEGWRASAHGRNPA